MECTACNKHEAIERELEGVRLQCINNERRIGLIEVANAKSDANYNYIIATLNELKGKIEGVLDKPRQRLDYLIVGAISLLGSVASGLILYKIMRG